MAGLCAAARARELGAETVVLEKGNRAGGSMRISSCVVWRYPSLTEFRAHCPGGDPALQRRVLERLDDALGWLESLGAPVVARATGNPATIGWRFDPGGLTAALVRAAGRICRAVPLAPEQPRPVVLATGGFGGALARRRGLALRANPWSDGDGHRYARPLGAAFSGDPEEFYGRLLPAAPVGEEDFVRAAQLYGRFAVLTDDDGRPLSVAPSWSEVELPQALARAGGRGWLVVSADALARRVRDRTVAEMIGVAEQLGGEVRRGDTPEALGLPRLARALGAEAPPLTAVRVVAAVTHTIGGLRIDDRARVLRVDGEPVELLYACGTDAGGIAGGGYASGLAAALVFGRIAAETAAAEL